MHDVGKVLWPRIASFFDPTRMEGGASLRHLPPDWVLQQYRRQRCSSSGESRTGAAMRLPHPRFVQIWLFALSRWHTEAELDDFYAHFLAQSAFSSDPKGNRGIDSEGFSWSGRRDLNPGPPAPQAGALARLRHGPNAPFYRIGPPHPHLSLV